MQRKCLRTTIWFFLITFPCVLAAQGTQPRTMTLREGTEVLLEFAEDLTSRTAAEDDKFNLRLAEDLKLGDVVVAKADSIAVGIVTNARKAGMMGKGGELNIRLEYLKVGDQRVRLRANKGKEGASKVGATIALTVLFGPIGLIKRGHNIDIKEGTALTAWVDQDTDVTIAETEPISPGEAPAAPPAQVSASEVRSDPQTFLLAAAAGDFHAHPAQNPAKFRNVRFGHLVTDAGTNEYLLCGEFLPASETGADAWMPFATIKTAAYEQWMGATATGLCERSSIVWSEDGDLSGSLQGRLDALRAGR